MTRIPRNYWSDICDKPSCVYRLFDAEGRLLYVGIATNPDLRIPHHRRRQPWGALIDTTTVEWHDDREAAKAAERRAITDENPIYNLVRPKVA